MTKTVSIPLESSTSSLRWQLRDATRPYHDKIEKHLNLHEFTLSRNEYRQLLEKMWGFYCPLEVALSLLDWHKIGFGFSARYKSGWLAEDIVDLGRAPHDFSSLAQCSCLPSAYSLSSGLGILYVLEGATLGGQLIIRRLGPELGISPTFAGRFFASYGGAVGSMWRSYLAALEQAGLSRDARDTIEGAAIETFAALEAWLETNVGNLAAAGHLESKREPDDNDR